MKTKLQILTLLPMLLLSGCALFKGEARVSVASPSVYVDGKAVEQGQKVVGDFKATTEKGKLYLKSFNFWSFIGGFGIWYFIGGAFLLAGVLSMIWFKAFKVAMACFASGASILVGAFFLKVFWVALAWATAIFLLVVAVLSIIHYRKMIVKKAKDLTK